MPFSDKLKTLMEITGTSNKALARHLIVDPSLISQLRTGARNVTRKNNHVKNMAFYFADKCQAGSRMLALYEIIGNEELKSECSIARLSDIIYEFMLDDHSEFDKRSSHYEKEEMFKQNPRVHRSELVPIELSDQIFAVSHNIEEKKEYMKRLFEYYMTLPTPDVIYFSSEEVIDWIYDDPEFYSGFRAWGLSLIERGFSFVRVMKPLENKEHFLENILLWFPLYMTGHVFLYYYPHFRDDIFRQTIIAVDHAASYLSSSMARTGTCYYDLFSTDKTLSTAYVKQVKDYLTFCKPSFYLCKTERNIASAFADLLSLQGKRITKSYQLSQESMPYKEMLKYMYSSDNEDFRKAAAHMERIYEAFGRERKGQAVIDMCTLASPEDVRAGKVRLQFPGCDNWPPVYYDTELYAMHLGNVLHMLETDSNYHFYPIDPADFGEYAEDYAPISAVDNQSVLLITVKHVLHFVQPDIIHMLYEHLYNESKKRAKHSGGREKIMEKIRGLLNCLDV